MEYTNDSDDFNVWQLIEQHSFPETSSLTEKQSSVAWNTVVINDNYLQFHGGDPSSVEGGSLQIVPTTMDSQDGTSSPSASSSSVSSEEGETQMTAAPPSYWRLRVANEGKKLLKLRFEAMRARVVRVVSKVRNCAIWAGAFWSITCVTGLAAAVLVLLFYLGIRRRRRRVGRQSMEHLLHLVRDKDERISQLLLQIAQLNEVLSSRRKVPVLRISS